MPSVYDSENYHGRVALAANYISRRLNGTRTFDTCFEMYDGDLVAVALYRRVTRNPDSALARNIWNYLNRESVTATAAKYAHVPTRQLPDVARTVRAKARADFERWLAQQDAENASSPEPAHA